MQYTRGFSLLELLIVIALLAFIGAAGVGFYRNTGKTIELSSAAQEIATDLRQMQSKAMIGEGGYRWGAHFTNGITGNDYYVLFSTLGTTFADVSTISVATTTLPNNITFSDPPLGMTRDIIFSKIAGTTTATTITIMTEGYFATTTVTAVGAIY